MFMVQILVFGDSITHGECDTEGGWVQRLIKYSYKKNLTEPNFYCSIYNLGVSGNATEDLIKRFEFETRQRVDEEEELAVIFAIGINDSQFLQSKNDLRCPPADFQENIQTLANLARKFSSKIIFIGLAPVDESRTSPIPWNTEKSYKNEYVRKYNDIIKSFCKENRIHFIGIFDKFMDEDYKGLLEDGLHPNSEGHKKIFEIVKNFLVKNKLI